MFGKSLFLCFDSILDINETSLLTVVPQKQTNNNYVVAT